MKKITQDSIILGIETTTNICSVALFDGQQIFMEVTKKSRSHSKTILPMIEKLLIKSDIEISAINFIACARGPGSFTGVRIGVGVAKGLAFGQDIAIIPISPLQAIAYRAMKSENIDSVMVLMDARMNELYTANYQNQDGLPVLQGKERLTNINAIQVGRQMIVGTGIKEYRQHLVAKSAKLSSLTYPYADAIVELARKLPIKPVSAEIFSPIYLRDKVTD